ncbi:MAG: DUF3883 domain-containing protein [Nibricoccus sp.]
MPAGENWSVEEVRAVVVDYMAMLKLELAGQPYSKTDYRRALLPKLDGRTEGAIELKHQNISAVLQDLGHFWISGYKPRGNYQAILADEVDSWVRKSPDLDRYALAAADAPAATPEVFDFSQFQVSSPERAADGIEEPKAGYQAGPRVGRKHDYVAREARNLSLGKAGEELVLKFERYRLERQGLDRLASRVEHVSQTQGDGLGFDVLSFDEDGRERFIEVKTTAFARETPFFASSSELSFARTNAERYFLCRVFEFKKRPRCFTLTGSFEEHCRLDPVTYRCSFA